VIIATILTNGAESTIAETIRSVLPLADRVLLVDTGIRDGTLTRAAEAAGDRLIALAFRWPNDFSAARNECLAAVKANGGQWYLMLDSDEIYECSDPAVVRQRIASEPDVDVWLISNETATYFRERLIRVSSPATWQGRTHESLVGVPFDRRRVLPGVRVCSRPKTAEQFRAKLDRDFVALQVEIADHPDEPRWRYYLGQTLEGLGRHADAADAYALCWELDGWSEQAAWACYRAACCLIEVGWFDDALEVCAIGLGKDARFPELAWLAGWICYQLNRYSEALAWGRCALAITDSGVTAERIGFRFIPGWSERPKNLLQWATAKL
jgi:tetratricopeptide (TPR) repeat protein